ncbi:hypothetical protein KIN20_027348 [Parelaphostrongylus tenuis]|uniref:Uncharacterized protein n=1 Tax=Parelaphostrongylus tenuis TaxID=148309 RepID=A0AAD5QZ81_PARTN|nr:hypothetical protein KIN20_027348 [Parelaphostrongylus tenuis]
MDVIDSKCANDKVDEACTQAQNVHDILLFRRPKAVVASLTYWIKKWSVRFEHSSSTVLPTIARTNNCLQSAATIK